MKAGKLLDHHLFGNLWVLDQKQGMVHQVTSNHWSPLAFLPDLETRLVLCASLFWSPQEQEEEGRGRDPWLNPAAGRLVKKASESLNVL